MQKHKLISYINLTSNTLRATFLNSYKNLASLNINNGQIKRVHYLIIIFSIIAPTLTTGIVDSVFAGRYKLTDKEKSMVLKSSVDAKYIIEDQDKISYNKGDDKGSLTEALSEIKISSKEESTGKFPYSAELPRNMSDGIVFTETKGNRSVELIPNDGSSPGRLEDGRVIYPSGSNEKSVYTFKRNGLKNDILITEKPKQDSKTYSWKISVEKNLEARMLDNGGVGVFSSSSLLFDNIQTSTDKDRELVENAKINGPKNDLIFELPAPYIIDADGVKNYQDVKYELDNDVLTLKVTNLKSKALPLSIDPTIIVTTTSDFLSGVNNTDGVNLSNSGEISRGDIDSGEIGSAGAVSYFTTPRRYHTSVVYNGYMYVIGGFDGTNRLATVQYAPINSDGTVGTWTSTNVFDATGREGHTSVVYNGYLYVIGGTTNGAGAGALATIRYALICTGSNNGVSGCNATAGTVGTWASTTSFTTARYNHTSVAYSGFLYVIGGFDGTTRYATVQYAPINANGTVGAWNSTTSFTTGRSLHTSVEYNGFLYVIGGFDGTNRLATVQYAPINTNGTVGTWASTASFTTARSDHATLVYNGYIYVMGGEIVSSTSCKDTGTSAYCNDVQYAQLNANGSLGNWATDTNSYFSIPRSSSSSVVYNGYAYIVGGYQSSSATTCKNSGTSNYCNDIQPFSLASNGNTPAWTTDNLVLNTNVNEHATVVAFGKMYVIGGNASTGAVTTVLYSTINTDGNISGNVNAWNTTTSLPVARAGHAAAVVGRYVYVSGTAGGDTTVYYAYICDGTTAGGCAAGVANIGLIGTWGTTTGMNVSRGRHVMISFQGRLYVAGGQSSTYLSSTEYANINSSNGTISSWTNGSSFMTGRRSFGLSEYKNYLYIVGGTDGTNLSDVQRAPINSADGSIGTWVTLSTGAGGYNANPLPVARHAHGMDISNGYIYVTGGYASSDFNTGYVAYICDGTTKGGCTAGSGEVGNVGPWQSLPVFTTARRSHTTVAVNGYIYVIGGCSGACSVAGDIIGTTQYAKIGPSTNGNDASVAQSGAFTPQRAYHASVVHNGNLYIIGGYNPVNGDLSDILYCPINTSGTVGTCSSTGASLNAARDSHEAVVYNNYLYVIAGYPASVGTACSTQSVGACNDIERCPINSNGTINSGSCVQQKGILGAHLANFGAAIYSNRLYLTGGFDVVNNETLRTIRVCDFNSDGSVIACSVQSNVMNSVRNSHATVINNGYLYSIGGTNGGQWLNDLEYCPINSNGSVGTCYVQNGVFTAPRFSHTANSYNGYLYIMGGTQQSATSNTGCSNSALVVCNDLQYCEFMADGTVGPCTQVINAFTRGRQDHQSVTYNGFIYISGGFHTATADTSCHTSSNQYCSDIVRIGLNTIRKEAQYEKIINLNSSLADIQTFTINGTEKCSYKVAYKTAGSDNVYGTLTTQDGVEAGTTYNITGGTGKGSIIFSINMFDSTCGEVSSITDISIGYRYYVPYAPTLASPSNGATGVSLRPEFRLGSTDDGGDYLRYKIEVCSNATCSTIVRTIDQTSSQTGWSSQSQQSATAYAGGEALLQYAIHTYQNPVLSTNTVYYWRGYAIDPGGSNTWSSASEISSFTTTTTSINNDINIGGGTSIWGGTTLQP